MKTLIPYITFVLLCLSIANKLTAQHGDATRSGTGSVMMNVDTVSKGSLACPLSDTSIISYEMVILLPGHPGIIYNVTKGNFPAEVKPMLVDMAPGSKIYYDRIIRRLPDGTTEHLPAHFYVIEPGSVTK